MAKNRKNNVPAAKPPTADTPSKSSLDASDKFKEQTIEPSQLPEPLNHRVGPNVEIAEPQGKAPRSINSQTRQRIANSLKRIILITSFIGVAGGAVKYCVDFSRDKRDKRLAEQASSEVYRLMVHINQVSRGAIAVYPENNSWYHQPAEGSGLGEWAHDGTLNYLIYGCNASDKFPVTIDDQDNLIIGLHTPPESCAAVSCDETRCTIEQTACPGGSRPIVSNTCYNGIR